MLVVGWTIHVVCSDGLQWLFMLSSFFGRVAFQRNRFGPPYHGNKLILNHVSWMNKRKTFLWLCMNQSFSKGKVYSWWIIPLLIWQSSRIIWTDICEWCRHFRSRNSQMMTTFDWVMGFLYLRLIWFKYPKRALPPGTTHPILRHRFCNKTKIKARTHDTRRLANRQEAWTRRSVIHQQW